MATNDPYATLNLAPGSDIKQVKKAFRKLALQMHPDVSDDPSHVEVFKQMLLAYESIIEGTIYKPFIVDEPSATPNDLVDDRLTDAKLTTLKQGWRLATEELRAQSKAATDIGDYWLAKSTWLADVILFQAMNEFCNSIESRKHYPGSSLPRSRPLLFDAAERFLKGTETLWAQPDVTTAANLARGALGAVGSNRVSDLLGAAAQAVDKELFARAVMSALASSLLQFGLIGNRNALGSSSTPIALMEASISVTNFQLSQRRRESRVG